MNFLRSIMSSSNGSGRFSDTLTDATDDDAGGGGDAAYVRRAHHSGSWYPADELDGMLSKFLADAEEEESDDGGGSGGGAGAGSSSRLGAGSVPNACISPHAGYRYSGPTAAHSFLALREALVRNPSLKTIVVLHPSHHVYIDGCALSGASVIETPLGNMRVDSNLRDQLLSTNKFAVMERDVDEKEHSGEMQYPYIAKIISDAKEEMGDGEGRRFDGVKVLPIMVGSIRKSKEEAFGRLLAPYLSDSGIFTVISSDFCHWGRRFSYMPQPSKSDGNINEIYEYIEYLDRKGMSLIEMQRPGAFADYLREYSNTICGRHPISVWLHSLRESALTHEVRFVKYAQSEKARSTRDHSVSYAGAVCRVAMFDG